MKRTLMAATLALSLSTAGALADTTIHVLSINRDTPEWKQLYLDTVKEYNDSHSGVKVEINFMEDEAFKQNCRHFCNRKRPPIFFIPGRAAIFTNRRDRAC